MNPYVRHLYLLCAFAVVCHYSSAICCESTPRTKSSLFDLGASAIVGECDCVHAVVSRLDPSSTVHSDVSGNTWDHNNHSYTQYSFGDFAAVLDKQYWVIGGVLKEPQTRLKVNSKEFNNFWLKQRSWSTERRTPTWQRSATSCSWWFSGSGLELPVVQSVATWYSGCELPWGLLRGRAWSARMVGVMADAMSTDDADQQVQMAAVVANVARSRETPIVSDLSRSLCDLKGLARPPTFSGQAHSSVSGSSSSRLLCRWLVFRSS